MYIIFSVNFTTKLAIFFSLAINKTTPVIFLSWYFFIDSLMNFLNVLLTSQLC